MLHGCIIEDDCLIGIGSTILNKAKIGKNSIIGANALVTENKVIPERSLVLGSPGKIVRQVTDEEIKSIKEKIFILPNQTQIYCGHGPSTNLGFEKENNPFLI